MNDEKEEIIFGIHSRTFSPGWGTSPIVIPPEIFIYDSNMNLLTNIKEVQFSADNGITIADISGDEKEEILIANDDSWLVHVYSPEFNNLLKTNYVTFTKYDGFSAGDIDNDKKDEFLIAIDEDDRVYIEKEPTIPKKIITLITPPFVLTEFHPSLGRDIFDLARFNITSQDIILRGFTGEGLRLFNFTPFREENESLADKPDLIITSVAVFPPRPRIYQPTTVKVEVYNNGTLNSSRDVNLTIYWNCYPLTKRIGPLGIHEKKEFTFSNALIFLEAERNEIVAMVDSNFEISELNESNNNFSKIVESTLGELMEKISPPVDLNDEPLDPISCPENNLMQIGRNKTPGGDFYRNSSGGLIRDPNNETIWLPDQGETSACGTYSLAYILRFLLRDDSINPNDIDDEIRAPWVGETGMFSEPLGLVRYARSQGLNAEIYNNGNFEKVKWFIDREIPVMLDLSIDASGDVFAGHWVVVVNYCNREKEYPPGAVEPVIGIYNPWGYQYEIPEDRLNVYWGEMSLWGSPLWNKLFIAISEQPLPEGDEENIKNELATAQAISQILNGLDDIGDGFSDIFTEGEIFQGLGEIVEGLGTTAVGVVNTLVGFIVGGVLLGLWGNADDVPFAGGFLTTAEELLGNVLCVSNEFIESLSENLGDLIENWYNPLEWAEFIGELIVNIGEAILGVLETIADFIVDVFEAIAEFFSDLWDLFTDFTCWLFGLGCPEMHCKTKYITSIDPCGETVTYINKFIREGAIGYIHTNSKPGLMPLYLYMKTDFETGNKFYYLSTDNNAHVGRENLTRISLLGYVNNTCGCSTCCLDLTNLANEKRLNLDTANSLGFLPKFKEPNTEKLWLFKNDVTGSYIISNDPCIRTRTFSSQIMEGHTRDNFLGYINLNPVPGAVKVYRYWNPENEEFFLSLNPNESIRGYRNTGFLGYIYLENISGSTPLYDFTGISSKEIINATTLCEPFEELRYRKRAVGYIHENKDNACLAELWQYCRRDIWYE